MSKNQRGSLIFIIILAVAIVFCGIFPFVLLPSAGAGVAMPVITVPGEPFKVDWPFPGFYLTNTMMAVILTDILVILFTVFAWRSSKGWTKEVPGRFQSIAELLGDFVYGMTKNFAGSDALSRNWLFPLAASIFLFLLFANWMKLVPGVESVGVMHCAGHADAEVGITVTSGYPRLGDRLWMAVPLNPGFAATEEDYHYCEEFQEGYFHAPDQAALEEAAAVLAEEEAAILADAELTPEGQQAALDYARLEMTESVWEHAPIGLTSDELKSGVVPYLYVVTPYVRGAATDLNVTIGLALVVFIAIQVFGVVAQGPVYFQKFINIGALGDISKKPMGSIDFIVGLFEIVSEIGKIISLAFRLFGNMFAGGILLAVMSFLVATLAPVIFYGLEVIITTIQAFVFAVLALVFSGQAMQGHHSEEEHH